MKKYHIGKSKVHGKGIILDRDVKKDEFIFKFEGKTTVNPPGIGNWREGPNWLQIGYVEWVIPGANSTGIYLNHSCNPTAGVKGKNKIVAVKPLKKGTEVTIDYALSETYPLWHLVCNCGSKNCRKVVKPYQDLPQRRKDKYKDYTSKYIKDMKVHLSWEDYIKLSKPRKKK